MSGLAWKTSSALKLPDDPWGYFNRVPGSVLVPVSKLKTIRARPGGIERAETHMAKAHDGTGPKRDPIKVRKLDDGDYEVVDGNSTSAIARKHGWKQIPVTFEEP